MTATNIGHFAQAGKARREARAASRSLWLSTALGLVIFALGGQQAAAAPNVVSVTGDTTPTPAVSPTWSVGGSLSIGENATGTLNIGAGGAVNNTIGSIGTNANSTGMATVTGAGATWTNSEELRVGQSGTGMLNVENGGKVSNTTGLIGAYSGSIGTATVTGMGSTWTNSDNLIVGNYGTGSLKIESGGAVSNIKGYIGGGNGSMGTATVTGVGSTWTNSESFTLGYAGNGTLNIEEGGTVSVENGTGTLTLASQVGSTGTLNIGAASGDPAAAAGTLEAGNIEFGSGTGTVVFNHTSTADAALQFSTAIKGTGTLAFENGWTSLTGDSSDFTGTTTVSDGSLSITGKLGGTEGSIDGSGTATVTGTNSTWANSGFLSVGKTDEGTLTVEDGGTVSNAVGSIGMSANSTGRATVTGEGSTWTNSGSLDVGQGGTGTLTVKNGGKVSNTSAKIGSNFDSTGTATVTGVGSTWTNSETLSIGNYGTGTLSIKDGGTVSNTSGIIAADYGSTGTATVTGEGSSWTNDSSLIVGNYGTGALKIKGGGTVSNTNGYIGAYSPNAVGTATVTGTGSTWNNIGVLTVGFYGTSSLNVTDGGTVFNTVGVVGSQAGSTGTATVTNSGSSWRNSGSLFVGNFGTGTLTIADGGEVAIHGGTGALTLASQAGSTGTLNIGAASGDPAAAAGTLKASYIQFGSGTGTVVFNHTGVTRDEALQFAPGISGTGTLVFEHGWTFLNGDNSAFIGTTRLTGGTVSVNGSIGGTTEIEAGARLQGNGTVGPVTLASGATLAPGNSIGTLNVAGNLTLAAGSTYEVEIDAAGNSDRVVASGMATLNGAGVNVVALDPTVSYVNGTSYTILTAAGGVVGTFAQPTLPSAFLGTQLTYSANDVKMALQVLSGPVTPTGPGTPTTPGVFLPAAETANQRAAATGLAGLSQAAGSADLALYNAVLFSPTYGDARIAFDQLSGEVHGTLAGGLIENAGVLGGSAMDRLDAAFAGQGKAGADAGPAGRATRLGSTGIDAWISGFGSWGETDATGNAAKAERDTGGFLVGADGLATETLRIGLLAGYSQTSIDVDARGSSADVDSTHVGIYAGTTLGAVSLKAGAAYSWNEIDTSRQVAFAAFRDSLSASYDSGTAQVFGEAAYRFDLAPGTHVDPFASLSYVSLDTDGFTETGGAAALHSSGDTVDQTFSTLGLRGSTLLPVGPNGLKANASLGWRHAYGDVTPETTLAFASGPAFAISGAPIARDAAVIEAGFGLDVAPGANLSVGYAGQFGDGVTQNGVKALFQVKF